MLDSVVGITKNKEVKNLLLIFGSVSIILMVVNGFSEHQLKRLRIRKLRREEAGF